MKILATIKTAEAELATISADIIKADTAYEEVKASFGFLSSEANESRGNLAALRKAEWEKKQELEYLIAVRYNRVPNIRRA